MSKHPYAEWIKKWVDGEEVEWNRASEAFDETRWQKVESLGRFIMATGETVFRVKPETVTTNGYCRYVILDTEGKYQVESAWKNGIPLEVVEQDESFVCWIDDEYQYHEIEVPTE